MPFDAWGRRVDAIEVSPPGPRSSTRRHAGARGGGLRAGAGTARARPPLRAAPSLRSQLGHLDLLPRDDGRRRAHAARARARAGRHAVPHLTSRDPAAFWTSGQWMTERGGGSDVAGGTRTVARPHADGRWRLSGHQVVHLRHHQRDRAHARARRGRAGGLSLFYVEQRLPDGTRNGITIHRLKDKLGTRALPTAELTMDGTLAVRVGEPGRGVEGDRAAAQRHAPAQRGQRVRDDGAPAAAPARLRGAADGLRRSARARAAPPGNAGRPAGRVRGGAGAHAGLRATARPERARDRDRCRTRGAADRHAAG